MLFIQSSNSHIKIINLPAYILINTNVEEELILLEILIEVLNKKYANKLL